MEKFVNFASGSYGRAIRNVVGAALVAVAMMANVEWAQWVIAGVGVLLILSGTFRFCVLNLLVGRKISACPN